MADHTADRDWIDCHALRRDEEAGRDGRGEAHDLNDNEWRPRALLLIDPDGTESLAGEEEEASAAEAKAEAEAKARLKAEEQARLEAKRKAEAEAQERARIEAEEKARREAEEKARRETEEKARKEAEEKARREAEERARREAEEKARREAEERARKEAEEKARREAEEKARKEAEEKARREAEEKARKEAEEKARREAEEKARREAEEKARREAEEKARKEAEEKARREAEEKARKEAEEKARREAEEKARKEAEKKEAERKAREEAEARAREEAEEKARALADRKAAKNLGKTFRRLIRETGPISLTQYMGESNARYYASRDPLGEEADFITAPEISQMFGELVGLWLADVWVKMGTKRQPHYVELGPGRGTLASDALRTAGRYGLEPQVHFIEGSRTLRKIQREAFPDCMHHDDLSTLPEDCPLLIVANEFFDALPIHQLVRSAQGWHERMVGLDGDELVFVAGDKPMDAAVPPSWKTAPQGTMIETSPAAVAVMGEIATRLKEQGGAALIVDYGAAELRAGSTLQAIRKHEKVDPLSAPGEADLTAHVDFELLQLAAAKHGAEVMGLQPQGEWLRQLGIDTRMEALQRRNPGDAEVIARQHARLTADDQMGLLFKVLGICGRRWPIGAGFD